MASGSPPLRIAVLRYDRAVLCAVRGAGQAPVASPL